MRARPDVIALDLEGMLLDLAAPDGTVISVSLRAEHYVGPEAVTVHLPDPMIGVA